MKITRKLIRSGSFRVPKEMIAAVGGECGMIIYGNVVVLTPERFEAKPVLKALRAITRMIELSSELEDEEMHEVLEKLSSDKRY